MIGDNTSNIIVEIYVPKGGKRRTTRTTNNLTKTNENKLKVFVIGLKQVNKDLDLEARTEEKEGGLKKNYSQIPETRKRQKNLLEEQRRRKTSEEHSKSRQS